MKVKTLIFSFNCDEQINGTAEKIRGFFASRYKDFILIHQHLNEKEFLYRAPLIQYKIFNGKSFVLGINEGADILQKIHEDIDFLKVGNTQYKIKEKFIVYRTDDFGTTNKDITYTFLTPWLALNEKNYEKYIMAGSWEKRKDLLEDILVGNILSMSKSLGYTVNEPIKVSINRFKEVKTKLKGMNMLGFLGNFKVNFEIPDFFGIGKSVSRSFGTIKRIEENKKA